MTSLGDPAPYLVMSSRPRPLPSPPSRPRPLSSPPILRRFADSGALMHSVHGGRKRQECRPPPGLPRYPRNHKRNPKYNFRYRMGEEATLLIEEHLLCSVCCSRFVEPRLLPCLHTFCTECIRSLIGDRARKNVSDEHRTSNSPPSGYESEGSRYLYSDVTPNSHATKVPSMLSLSSCGSTRSIASSLRSSGSGIICPTCKAVTDVPSRGVEALPLDHVTQKAMVLSDLNHPSTLLLCDLCIPEVTAMSRCDDCLTNLCEFCSQAHSRQRHTAGHTVESLEEARRKGIKKVHRVVMCAEHPYLHVNSYCPSCRMTICEECCTGKHKSHSARPLSEMAHHLLPSLTQLLENTRPERDRLSELLSDLSDTSSDDVSETLDDINKYYDSYLQTIQEYKERLLLYVKKLQEKRTKTLRVYRVVLEKALADIKHACGFVQTLVSEGSEEEILDCYSQVSSRLSKVSQQRYQLHGSVTQSITFHPEERAGVINGHVVYGAVGTSSRVCPSTSSILTEGLDIVLQNQVTELTLDLRDNRNQTVRSNHADISARVTCKANRRCLPVQYPKPNDGQDVKLQFIPTALGLHTLSVKIGSRDVKGSPYQFFVHPFRECTPLKVSASPHSGIFHCCSFCSSGGNKEAECSCGGKMPGGYNGCGHGHQGHPGHKHWSCCGSTWETSECTRQGQVYQVTL